LQQFVTSSEVDLTHELKFVFEEHLTHLNEWSEKYFPEDMEKFAWIQDPFMAKAPSDFTSAEEENLFELFCDKSLKTKLCSMEVTEF
jgi:hypothetical protein